MKIIKSIALLVIAGVVFTSCKKDTEVAEKIIPQNAHAEAPMIKKEIAAENLQTATFKIDGMVCAMGCAKAIQDDLTKLDGVQAAEVDFDKKIASVSFDKTIQNKESLIKTVQAEGDGVTYKVSNFK
ncbi:heavy-metal-associated domain-containing protein [Flavobacterium sp. 7A]|uniref:heavy-metal-associated domain-containing protein n=1 Tax=Flavobacterium sp. 7A TaxID=2940571 RepID=UPI0022266E73|nr:heavy metal-associated domain-containing protein [Flavobacterium sp. 7A]MCW2117891.1 copper chaperone CopZ [Flavobacterium sp. 7A]